MQNFIFAHAGDYFYREGNLCNKTACATSCTPYQASEFWEYVSVGIKDVGPGISHMRLCKKLAHSGLYL